MAAQLTIAILGTGAIGTLTRDALEGVPNCRVVAMVSPRRPYEFGPEIDVVAVCTPNGLHATHARQVVAAGKHVVIEKPLTLDVAEGEALLAEADAAGVTVSVISQRRWEPVVVAAKRAIEGGTLGRAIFAECLLRWRRDPAYYTDVPWRGTTALDGGVLFNQGIHLIDLARWLFGPVDGVDGAMTTRVHDIEAPDTAGALLHFRCGAMGLVAATTAAHDPQPAHLNLWFEHGTIRLDDDLLAEWSVPGVPALDPQETTGTGSARPLAIGTLGHRRQWTAVVEALRAGRQPEVTGRDALGTSALVAAIRESAVTGLRITPAVA